MTITDTWLKNNHRKINSKINTTNDRDGLSIRASCLGKLTFQMRYRFDGKQRRLDIGNYPEMSLKNAREQNVRLRGELNKGYNPSIIKMSEKKAIMERESFKDVFDCWHKVQCAPFLKSSNEIYRSFEIHIFKEFSKFPADDIVARQWSDLLIKLAAKFPHIAIRVQTQANKMYKWAKKTGRVSSNPLEDASYKDLGVVKNKGSRVLEDREIMLLWEALRNTRMQPMNKLLLKLCLFFGCRVGELMLAEKSHFDLEKMIWTVPPENHKVGRKRLKENKDEVKPINRPIINEIIPTLERVFLLSQSTKWAFTSSNFVDPMRENGQIDLPYSIINWVKKNKKEDMKHWSTHDLRRTMRTNVSPLTSPLIAEMMLGHEVGGLFEVYDHYDYISEMRDAYTKWWDKLNKITGGFEQN